MGFWLVPKLMILKDEWLSH